MINFKEIPKANENNGIQDRFEQFAQDFLESIGYEIIQPVARGIDGKVDIIISENRKGIKNSTKFKWLVSCKHYAHSGRSVTKTEEPDIYDRINSNDCSGFIGFYSTIANNSLISELEKLKKSKNIEYFIFTNIEIEKEIHNNLKIKDKSRILNTYFPIYFSNWSPIDFDEKASESVRKTELSIVRTAIITVEIMKIIDSMYDDEDLNKGLDLLYKYSRFNTIELTEFIIHEILSISFLFRSPRGYKTANNLTSIIITFLPSFSRINKQQNIDIFEKSCNVAYNMIYYSFKYTFDSNSYQCGFDILEFLNTLGKNHKIMELQIMVQRTLKEIRSIVEELNHDKKNLYSKEMTYFCSIIK